MLSSKALAFSHLAIRAPVTMVPAFRFSNLNDKERAEEKAYMSKQDAKLLKTLLEKIEAREKLNTPTQKQHSAYCADLDAIFKEHGLNKASEHALLYQELIEWKKHQH